MFLNYKTHQQHHTPTYRIRKHKTTSHIIMFSSSIIMFRLQYISGNPLGDHERRLLNAGYRWVRTNEIQATKRNPSKIPDRLEPHSHHGENTHLIIAGDLNMQSMDNRGRVLERVTANPEQLAGFGPNVTYSATSTSGCRFVEGHRALSPVTAERFMARGTIEAVGEALPDFETLSKWLLDAEFNPQGYARPIWILGERQILKFRDTGYSTRERAIQRAMAEWFENEWKGNAPVGFRDVFTFLWSCTVVMVFGIIIKLMFDNYQREGKVFGRLSG
ncbi:hypothetical protein F5Y15DRAFT_370480 [Xylariaceae sp. FL0016]|nr:hypothetical protein F5Y15DRAFT_370480 [Xylariaceae sp. FL0016]